MNKIVQEIPAQNLPVAHVEMVRLQEATKRLIEISSKLEESLHYVLGNKDKALSISDVPFPVVESALSLMLRDQAIDIEIVSERLLSIITRLEV